MSLPIPVCGRLTRLCPSTPDVYNRNAFAGVAELADAMDSKSIGLQGPCGFDSHPRHQDDEGRPVFWSALIILDAGGAPRTHTAEGFGGGTPPVAGGSERTGLTASSSQDNRASDQGGWPP